MMRSWVLASLSVAVAGVALAAAFGAEWVGELVPCALCLAERWPYRVVAALGVLALVAPARLARPVLWGVAACMAAAVVLASVHLGVEQGWWPSPLPECAAPNLGTGSIAERFARMPAHPAKPCDDPTFLLPGVPVSMAALNGLLALAFGLWLAICLLRTSSGASHEPRRDAASNPSRDPGRNPARGPLT